MEEMEQKDLEFWKKEPSPNPNVKEDNIPALAPDLQECAGNAMAVEQVGLLELITLKDKRLWENPSEEFRNPIIQTQSNEKGISPNTYTMSILLNKFKYKSLPSMIDDSKLKIDYLPFNLDLNSNFFSETENIELKSVRWSDRIKKATRPPPSRSPSPSSWSSSTSRSPSLSPSRSPSWSSSATPKRKRKNTKTGHHKRQKTTRTSTSCKSIKRKYTFQLGKDYLQCPKCSYKSIIEPGAGGKLNHGSRNIARSMLHHHFTNHHNPVKLKDISKGPKGIQFYKCTLCPFIAHSKETKNGGNKLYAARLTLSRHYLAAHHQFKEVSQRIPKLTKKELEDRVEGEDYLSCPKEDCSFITTLTNIQSHQNHISRNYRARFVIANHYLRTHEKIYKDLNTICNRSNSHPCLIQTEEGQECFKCPSCDFLKLIDYPKNRKPVEVRKQRYKRFLEHYQKHLEVKGSKNVIVRSFLKCEEEGCGFEFGKMKDLTYPINYPSERDKKLKEKMSQHYQEKHLNKSIPDFKIHKLNSRKITSKNELDWEEISKILKSLDSQEESADLVENSKINKKDILKSDDREFKEPEMIRVEYEHWIEDQSTVADAEMEESEIEKKYFQLAEIKDESKTADYKPPISLSHCKINYLSLDLDSNISNSSARALSENENLGIEVSLTPSLKPKQKQKDKDKMGEYHGNEDYFECSICSFKSIIDLAKYKFNYAARNSARSSMKSHFNRHHNPVKLNDILKGEDGKEFYKCTLCDFTSHLLLYQYQNQRRTSAHLALSGHYLSAHFQIKEITTNNPSIEETELSGKETKLPSKDVKVDNKETKLTKISKKPKEKQAKLSKEEISDLIEGEDYFSCPNQDCSFFVTLTNIKSSKDHTKKRQQALCNIAKHHINAHANISEDFIKLSKRRNSSPCLTLTKEGQKCFKCPYSNCDSLQLIDKNSSHQTQFNKFLRHYEMHLGVKPNDPPKVRRILMCEEGCGYFSKISKDWKYPIKYPSERWKNSREQLNQHYQEKHPDKPIIYQSRTNNPVSGETENVYILKAEEMKWEEPMEGIKVESELWLEDVEMKECGILQDFEF